MQVDFPYAPTIRREPYLEYEFVADIGGGAKILFNDPKLSYNHLVALETSNKLLRFQLIGAQPTMTISGDDFLVYPSVIPQVDLAYELYPGRLKEILVLNSPDAQHAFTFILETDGVTAYLQDDNAIVYKDADSNTVWTIDAPYATDANGAAVKTSLDFNGSTYTISAIPDSSTAYPVKLDPTVTFAPFLVWNYDSIVSSATMPAYRMGVAAADNSLLVTKLTVYCRRKYETTYYYGNTIYNLKTYYQFYDSNNQPISDKTDLVVSSYNETASISIPAGAYSIEFTGSIVNDMAKPISNILRIVSVETSASKLDITQRSLTNLGSTIAFKLDDRTFNNSSNGTTVSKTIDAPVTSTFKAGTYTVTCSRTMYGYHNATAYLYKTDGTLYSSTKISYPSVPSGGVEYSYKTTSLVVPEGIAKITVTGTRYAGSATYTDSNVTFEIPLKTPDYGTAKYTLTLTEDANGLSIVPVFTPCRPANQYKTYVCYGSDIPANYSESKTVTAPSGTVVNVKVVLNADESANTTTCSTLYLANIASTKTNVTVTIDTARGIINQALVNADVSRSTAVLEDAVVETKRKIAVTGEMAAKSLRFLVVAVQVPVDINRTVFVDNTIINDTRRRIIKSASAILSDTKRRLIAPFSHQFDSNRSIANRLEIAVDARRKLRCVIITCADTKRCTGQAMRAYISLDTIREICKRVVARGTTRRNVQNSTQVLVETKRRIGLSQLSQADTLKKSTQWTKTSFDTGRNIYAPVIRKLDTQRKTVRFIHTLYDSKRTMGLPLVLLLDSKRKITDGVWPYIRRHEINIRLEEDKITLLSFTD